MRSWRTEVHSTNGEDLTRSSTVCNKTFKIKDIRDIVNPIRKAEVRQGLPKRKLTPVFTYLLDIIIGDFLSSSVGTDRVLEKIVIEDIKNYV